MGCEQAHSTYLRTSNTNDIALGVEYEATSIVRQVCFVLEFQ